jgi:acyl-CoA dehydrogenase
MSAWLQPRRTVPDSAVSEVLDFLLGAPAKQRELPTLEAWWSAHRSLAKRFASPVDHAFAAGFSADRLGYAFGSGYQCAGVAMFPAARGNRLTAFCATESGGVHPRAIETALTPEGDGFRLRGHKSFVTFGPAAELLLVVAHRGADDEGRKRLCVVALEPGEGVSVEPLAELPFVPEIPHAALTLDVIVSPESVLPGDGYARYLKPFRTVEDCYVHAALLGWLIAVGRRARWSQEQLALLCSMVVTIRALACADPSSPAVHMALGGALLEASRLVAGLDWEKVDAVTRQRFERDRSLLGVAGKARALRLEAAWRRVAPA